MEKTATDCEAKRPPVPRQSLCATHPSNYTQATNKTMPPPSSKVKKPKKTSKGSKAMDSAYAQNTADTYPTPSPSPPRSTQQVPQSLHTGSSRAATMRAQSQPVNKPTPTTQVPRAPWLEHADPTFTASDRPVYWSQNHTVLKSDTNLAHGSTVSPTFMHGLPFGSMVEAAYHYPSEERLERLS